MRLGGPGSLILIVKRCAIEKSRLLFCTEGLKYLWESGCISKCTVKIVVQFSGI